MEQKPTDIKQFIHALSDMPMSDLLVHVPLEAQQLISFNTLPASTFEQEMDSSWKSLWQVASKFRQESDTNSLCLTYGIIHWEHKGRQLRTPLVLVPLHWDFLRVKNSLSIELNETALEINPFVKYLLKEWRIDLPEYISEIQSAEDLLQFLKQQLTPIQPSWSISDELFVGNFHYHRYHLLRELEGIDRSESESVLVNELLGKSHIAVEPLSLPTSCLVPADRDQTSVFEALQEHNVVVHGPPGTGKSQVLINLLGKTLARKLKAVVVSEKRVALDVLVKKMADYHLDQHAFVFHSQAKSKDFLKQLKETWVAVEELPYQNVVNILLTEQKEANLQLLLDRLNAPAYFQGISFQEFAALRSETPFVSKRFSSLVPDLASWLEVKPLFIELDSRLGGFSVLKGLKSAFFETWNGDQVLNRCVTELEHLQRLFPELHTITNLDQLHASLGRCQLVENEYYKSYSKLIGKPKEWKKFLKQVSDFKSLVLASERLQEEVKIWKQTPTDSQLESWKQAKGWFQLRKRNKAIAKLLTDSSILPELAIENWYSYQQNKEKLAQIEQYFTGLGLQATCSSLDLGLVFVAQLEKESNTLLSEVASWTSERRRACLKVGGEIQQLRTSLNRYFEWNEQEDMLAFLKEKEKSLDQLLLCQQTVKSIPSIYFSFLADCADWRELQELVVYSNWKKMEALNPEFVQFSGDQLSVRLESLIQTEEEECLSFATLIQQQIRSQFVAYHELLRTAATKLSPKEKELKAKLRKGKAILVKEFGKTRSHESIRNLLASDARLWIQMLIPVWLATPSQVADHFPLETDLFDLLLFDEAGQIPLPHAMGALYRSKRVLVAGDDQQMSPSTYFGKDFGFSDLLNQALYYLKRVNLRHHYRSSHAQLIQFSNTHFYHNELIVYPSSERKQVLFRYEIPNGVFINRQNSVEAQAVAQFLENWNHWNGKSIGIVAFSEEQLKAIWESCSSRVQEQILMGIDENRIFFKALENVQGDEADVLLVGMGYGKNEEGEFALRFGPLNLQNGYKRLNVLLTRAREEMHFFTSVKSTDFKLSENESVQLLRLYLRFLETNSNQALDVVSFPYQLEASEYDQKNVSFNHIYHRISDAKELLTFHRLMKKRGWNVRYTSN